MSADETIPVPTSDKDGTQRIYDLLAGKLQSMPESIRKSPRFVVWAITAVINVLCRLVIANSDMTKEQLQKQVGDIFSGYKEGKAEKRFLN